MANTSISTVLTIGGSDGPIASDYKYYNMEEHELLLRNYGKDLRKRMNTVSMVIYSLAFVLGVTGNGLVIFITGFRMKKTVNTVWFLNLAIADFTFTFFLPLSIMYLAWDFHWPFGQAMCKLNSTIAFLNLYASVYLLMVISIDRYISVWYPVWAQNHRTPRLASFVALGVWILALVLCSPNIHFRKTAKSLRNETVIKCYTDYGFPDYVNSTEAATIAQHANSTEAATIAQHANSTEAAKITQHAVIISRFIFAFIIPFSVILVCYGAIVMKICGNRLSQSNKPFKVITAVIVAFFVCWFPYHVFSFLELKADDEHLHLALYIGIPLTSSLAFVNSCLNPILYVFMGHDFKERLRRSILSVFENAFAEDEANQSTTDTRKKSTAEHDSQNL